jgi:hypothetical protein
MFMRKLVKNDWRREVGEPFAIAHILRHDMHPEGLDVSRIRFLEAGRLTLESGVGRVISVFRGRGRLHLGPDDSQSLYLETGIHFYLPPGLTAVLDAEPGTELVRVSSPTALQARGKQPLFRDERFLAACALRSQSLRWILTPQYLSRRIFLHHDATLLSKSGHPVSWFHTTMFDVTGLPKNEDGEPVFKMSYNSRTEFNVCYEVKGAARVRMALHPYRDVNQKWAPWLSLDADSTYHLNEAAGSCDEECSVHNFSQTKQFLRNKHEVHIVDGHVSLFCLFDPAPVGIERHRPGEYSDYEPLSQILGTQMYETHQRAIASYDEMVDRLSVARAAGELSPLYDTPIWQLYLQGRNAQERMETELKNTLAAEGTTRASVLLPWMLSATG